MTVQSVLSIDVQAQAFERYTELFRKYEAAAAKQPALWKSISKEQAAGSGAFNRMASAVQAQARVQREMSEVYKTQNRSLMQGERLWGSMASHAKGIASSIVGATRSMLSWSGIIGTVGGLLGAGSLFGIDRMAANVANTRRTTMGLGMSSGEYKSFGINFGRLVDTDSFLGKLNEMETNPAAAGPMSVLGVIPTGNTQKDAVAMLRAMRGRALMTPLNQVGMLGQITGMDVGTETWRRLHDMKQPEFQRLITDAARDTKTLGYSDKTAKAWTDFTTQMQRAGQTLENTFVTGLVRLSGPLQNLSGAFTKLLGTVMGSPLVREGVDKFAGLLGNLAKEMNSSDFQKSVKSFFSDTGTLGTMFHAFSEQLKEDLPAIASTVHFAAHPLDSARNWASSGFMKTFRPDDFYSQWASKGETSAFLAHVDEMNKLPKGLTAKAWQLGSGSSFSPPVGPRGETGPFGLDPRMAAAFGANPKSFVDSSGAWGYDIAQLREKYHGDLREALAVYKSRNANMVEGLVRQHPSDWQRYLPQGVGNYVSSMTAPSPGVTITINNNTGGSAIVTANQLAH